MIEQNVIHCMEHLCPEKGTLLVCVSGGIDSIVLLDILYHGGWDISVAHCNFSLRGEESDGDENFVKNVCKKYGVTCHVKRFDTNGYAKEHGLNTQIAARELRYGFFEELRKEYGYSHIVIAHHLDDDIETFFINLLRGTGLRGLSGISDTRDAIIRPMLSVTREEISEYANRKGLSHREDHTNGEDHYLRNKIRHHIIPALVELSPSFRKTMSENIHRLYEARDYLDECINIEKNSLCTGPMEYSITSIKNHPHCNIILFELLHPLGFNSDVISQLQRAISENSYGKWFIGDSLKILLEKDHLKIMTKEEYSPIEPETITIYSANIVSITDIGDYRHAPHNTAYLDADKLTFPLTIRKWSAGDRIHPLGMKGSKTIGDFLTDRKISIADREKIKVVMDGSGEIAWIVDMQVSEKFKIDSRTTKVVKL